MWSWRKEIHKLSNINPVASIPCNEVLTFNGGQGIFIIDINIGSELGEVVLNYNAFGVPDRFQIEYDGVIVADSLYVGNDLTGNPPDLVGGFVGNTYNNVPEYFWDGTQFVLNGNTQNLTIQQSDVAPLGYTAGADSISFQKISSTPTVMTIRIFAPLGGTEWTLDSECPTTIGIGCNENLQFSSDDQAGQYFTEVELGLDVGLVTLDYNAGDIPDRFTIIYDGNIVADSKLVGDYLTGNPPDADTALWESLGGSGMFVGKTYNNIPDYAWDGASFVATGATNNYTVQQSDVANFGDTAGLGSISFVKPSAFPTTMTVVVLALPDNTGFDFTPNCPVPPLVQQVLLGEGERYETACSDSFLETSPFYILTTETFQTATILYSDSGATNLAPLGWYSDTNVSRYWDGTQFDDNVEQVCTVAPVLLGYDGSTSVAACNDFGSNPSYYHIPIGETFATATELHLEGTGSSLAFAGFYSDGTNWREWNGTAFINNGSC